MKRTRWFILLLLFAASVLNYIDRQTLSIMARTIQNELHISDSGYAFVVEMFLLAYMLGFLTVGWIADRLGVRRSMTLFVGWWSISDMLTGLATSLRSLGTTRFLLGIGEAGFYTVAPKVVSEWFSPSERGLAVGIYTAGATIGATLAPPLLAWLTLSAGWRRAFYLTGSLGLLWCLPWLWIVKNSRRTVPVPSAAGSFGWIRERGGLRGDVLLLLLARTFTDPVFTFVLFWFPKYLTDVERMSLTQLGRIAWVVYFAADLGSLLGGFFSGLLIRRGMEPARARQIVMTGAACFIPLSFAVPYVRSQGAVIILISAVAFGHVIWMVTLTTLAVDIVPETSLGSIFGIISVGSGLGGMLATSIIGYMVSHHSYNPVFRCMAILHPLALLLIWRVGKARRHPQHLAALTNAV